MKKSLIILALLAGCGAADHGGNGQKEARAPQGEASRTAAPAPEPARPSDAPGLVGLYQSGNPARPNQLCIAEKGDSTQFGITIWGPNMAACSGAGLARSQSGKLTLTMTGDSACTLTAEVSAGKLILPASVPEGCAYYCGSKASFAGAAFGLKQAGAAGAAKAKDVAGDPLCG